MIQMKSKLSIYETRKVNLHERNINRNAFKFRGGYFKVSFLTQRTHLVTLVRIVS